MSDISYYITISYFTALICSLSLGYCSDKAIESGYISRGRFRKLMFGIAAVPSSLMFFLATYTSSWKSLTVVIVTIATTLVVFQNFGLYLTVNDVSLHFTGSIIAISNIFGIIAMIVQPILLGSVLDKGVGEAQYRSVFVCMSVISAGGTFIFVAFGTSKGQEWDFIENETEDGKSAPPLDSPKSVAPEIWC